LTGNTLFRVHRSFFERESEVFRELFASAAEDDPLVGSDARPFRLQDVTVGEFEQLLWVWYDRDYNYREQTKENWVTILRLSTRWSFPKITGLAVRQLEALHLPPAEMISIYNRYGIDDERLLDSYVELCRSPTLPTEADGHLMQMETLINILQAREDAQRKAVELGHESPTSASLEDSTLREILSKFFKKGLNGERAHRTGANPTITVGAPQVPDRKAQPTSGPASHANDSPQTGSKGKESQEKEQEKEKEKEEKTKAEKAKEAKEREELAKAEKAKQDREKEEEKARQAREKEREKAEKAEKAKQEKEKEAREKAQKPEEPKSWLNNRGNSHRRF